MPPPTWKQDKLLSLSFFLRKVNREREQAFETSMKLYQDASPKDVGVPAKLFPPDPSTLQGSYPYESAVQELELLVKDCCPQKKLECIGESRGVVLFSLKQMLTFRMDINLNVKEEIQGNPAFPECHYRRPDADS